MKPRKRRFPAEWRVTYARLRAQDGEILRPLAKEPISLRVDADVLVWFRRQGRGYQTRMNAVLRQHMRAIVGGIAPDS